MHRTFNFKKIFRSVLIYFLQLFIEIKFEIDHLKKALLSGHQYLLTVDQGIICTIKLHLFSHFILIEISLNQLTLSKYCIYFFTIVL